MHTLFTVVELNTQVRKYLTDYQNQSFSAPRQLALTWSWFQDSSNKGQFFSLSVRTPQSFKFNVIYWIMLQLFNLKYCESAQKNFNDFSSNEPEQALVLQHQSATILKELDEYFKTQNLAVQIELVNLLKEMCNSHDNGLIQLIFCYFQVSLSFQPCLELPLEDPITYNTLGANPPENLQPKTFYRFLKNEQTVVTYLDVFGNKVSDYIPSGGSYPDVVSFTPEQKRQLNVLQDKQDKIVELDGRIKQIPVQRLKSGIWMGAFVLLAVNQFFQYFLPNDSLMSNVLRCICFFGLLRLTDAPASNQFNQQLVGLRAELAEKNQAKQQLEKRFYSENLLCMRITYIKKLVEQIEHDIQNPSSSQKLAELSTKLYEQYIKVPRDCNHTEWRDHQIAERVKALPEKLKGLLMAGKLSYDRRWLFPQLYIKAIFQLGLSVSLIYGITQVSLAAMELIPQVILIAAMAALLLYVFRALYLHIQRLHVHHAAIAPQPNNSLALSRTP